MQCLFWRHGAFGMGRLVGSWASFSRTAHPIDFALNTALPWVRSNTPAECEVDRVDSSRDMQRTDIQTMQQPDALHNPFPTHPFFLPHYVYDTLLPALSLNVGIRHEVQIWIYFLGIPGCIFLYSATGVLQRSATDVGESSPEQLDRVAVRASKVVPRQTGKTISSWTSLCTHKGIITLNDPSPNCHHKAAQYCLKYHCMQ